MMWVCGVSVCGGMCGEVQSVWSVWSVEHVGAWIEKDQYMEGEGGGCAHICEHREGRGTYCW